MLGCELRGWPPHFETSSPVRLVVGLLGHLMITFSSFSLGYHQENV